VFAPKATCKKHHTNDAIDNGFVAVDKASLFVPAFCGTFDVMSKANSCATLQKHHRKERKW
jgi:hypothetical protein